MFYVLKTMPYNPFKRQIKAIKKRYYTVVILRKSLFGNYNFKGLIKRFGNVFVTEKGFKNEQILPYNTENFINNSIENYLKNITSKEPIFKNSDGDFLPDLLKIIGKKQTVFIKTNNKNAFINLCEDAFNLYGVEPIFFDEKSIENTEDFYDIDAFLKRLCEPLYTDQEYLKNCEPLQLKAAFFECMEN